MTLTTNIEVFCDDSGIQCGPYADCIYNRTLDHSTCACLDGYIGDGFECEPFRTTIWKGKWLVSSFYDLAKTLDK